MKSNRNAQAKFACVYIHIKLILEFDYKILQSGPFELPYHLLLKCSSL